MGINMPTVYIPENRHNVSIQDMLTGGLAPLIVLQSKLLLTYCEIVESSFFNGTWKQYRKVI